MPALWLGFSRSEQLAVSPAAIIPIRPEITAPEIAAVGSGG
jgi:hypothetical protein